MKHFQLERSIESQTPNVTMHKDDVSTASEHSFDSPNSDQEATGTAPNGKPQQEIGRSGSTRLTVPDVCDPKFGSWCDDSSTENDDDDDDDDDDDSSGDDSFDSNDNIVVNFSSLNTESFTSFYSSLQDEEESREFLSSDDDEDDLIQISQKRRRDEELVLENLKRRQLRFTDKPSVKEFEPAPYSCHNDMYYSCHQLQKMMDAYYEGREFQLEEEGAE